MINIFCDGGARGNPGPSAYGFVVKNGQEVLHKEGGYLGIATNNYAEYTAVIKALSWLSQSFMGYDLSFFLDSKLVSSQLSGLYKVRNAKIRELVIGVKSLETNFRQITYSHIPREQNKEADKLVNEALDRRNN